MQGRLHPGVRIALARGKMDEAQVARAIAAGELTSPQQYGNSWLFNMRITGTGGAYRESHDEYVWRDPALYLNQGFLDRCAGLPVILEHPKKEMLDSAEFQKRVVGTILYPYIRGDEVWGVARILDEPTSSYMREHQLSTSPAVVFRRATMGEKIKVGDGKHLLIEGRPSLVDHLAICEEGVWDKGGPPAGVDVTSSEESTMAERRDDDRRDRKDARRDDDDKRDDARRDDDDRRDDRVRDDADGGEKIDKLLEGIKVLSDRMDSLERGRKDASAEEEAEQAATLHKLAEEEEEEAKEAAEDDSKKDSRKRDDSEEDEEKKKEESMADKRDDGTLHIQHRDDAEEDEKMPWEEGERKEGESDSAYSRRMDAMARKHDARHAKRDDESIAAHCDRMDAACRRDRARKDARRRLDAVDTMADSIKTLAGRIDRLTRHVEERSDEDETSLTDAQSRADDVYAAFGDHAPRPMRGERPLAYRIRLARGMQKHSDAWKDSDLGVIARADPTAFANVEKMVFADAAKAARTPTGIAPGTLREVQVKRQGGGVMYEFIGEPLSWMVSFMQPARAAGRLSRPRQT